MDDGLAGLLQTGAAALAEGRWEAARRALADAVAADPSPEALQGLATAEWWLGRVPEAVAAWERAYAGFRAAGDDAAAAVVAVGLSLYYHADLGNHAASAGWAGRAGRLAETVGAPVLQGWALLARSVTCPDPAQVESWAVEAQGWAVEAGDRDLELCALSTRGAALVEAGRVAEGTALLDEALAGSLGGESLDLDTVVFTSCLLMKSCSRCADFPRVRDWVRVLDRFVARYGCPFLHATCRTRYGAALVASGEWDAAERELTAAVATTAAALPAVRADALAQMAELRLAQGRLEEARTLVAGFEEHDDVAAVLAATALAEGDAALAAATARRALAHTGPRPLLASRLREVLGEALLAAGDPGSAEAQGRELARLGADLDCELVAARGERLLGRVLAGTRPADALAPLEAALRRFALLGLRLEVARTKLLVATALEAGEPVAAAAEARGALRVLDELGAAPDADRAAAWLRDRGARVSRSRPGGSVGVSRREQEVLALVGEGLSNPEIAERLYVSRRTVEHHVASLLAKVGVRNRTELAAYALRHRRRDVAADR